MCIKLKMCWKQISPSSIGLLAMSICLRCFSKPCHWNELYRREFSDICGMFCNVRSLYSGCATRCSNRRPRKEVVILATNMCNFQKRKAQYQWELNVSRKLRWSKSVLIVRALWICTSAESSHVLSQYIKGDGCTSQCTNVANRLPTNRHFRDTLTTKGLLIHNEI